MKTKPTYKRNILTQQLKDLPDGTLFSEHIMDSLTPEPVLLKKIRTCLDGGIIVQPMTTGQFSEVPGQNLCLGHAHDCDKEWRVWSRDSIEKMVGWLMTTSQYFED